MSPEMVGAIGAIVYLAIGAVGVVVYVRRFELEDPVGAFEAVAMVPVMPLAVVLSLVISIAEWFAVRWGGSR